MVVYVFFIAVLNISLGFALAAYLACCYRRLLADRDADVAPPASDTPPAPPAITPPEQPEQPAPPADESGPADDDSPPPDAPDSIDQADDLPKPEASVQPQVTSINKIPDEEFARILDSVPER